MSQLLSCPVLFCNEQVPDVYLWWGHVATEHPSVTLGTLRTLLGILGGLV